MLVALGVAAAMYSNPWVSVLPIFNDSGTAERLRQLMESASDPPGHFLLTEATDFAWDRAFICEPFSDKSDFYRFSGVWWLCYPDHVNDRETFFCVFMNGARVADYCKLPFLAASAWAGPVFPEYLISPRRVATIESGGAEQTRYKISVFPSGPGVGHWESPTMSFDEVRELMEKLRIAVESRPTKGK